MKIAVFGAGGFVGSRLIDYCHNRADFEFTVELFKSRPQIGADTTLGSID